MNRNHSRLQMSWISHSDGIGMMMVRIQRLSGENFLFKERENHIGTESESSTEIVALDRTISISTITYIHKLNIFLEFLEHSC